MMKPGKPLMFATVPRRGDDKDVLFFGTPGNPASSLVTTYLFAIPALRRMCGIQRPTWPRISVRVVGDLRLDRVRPEYHRAIAYWSTEVWLMCTAHVPYHSLLRSAM